MDSIVKVDMTADADSGLVATIRLPEGTIGGEFSVVPKQATGEARQQAEDDAWLIGYCRHHQTLESFCLVRLTAA
ncbi:MAG: carotenoid oxygenase family protein [Akkermansiaceae bacterium]|nr:carotenoid oxygenase family protein [Akkermansiaceae bacterium]